MRACKISQSSSKKGEKEHIPNECGGIDYPFDLWFTLAKHIHPEDIGKFAVLCKTSAAVLNSKSFWIGFYNRYYDICYQHRLPTMLRLVNISRSICLRMNVIRALYYMYPPFKERSVAIVPNIHVHPEFLIGRTCVLVWQEICSARTVANYSDQWRYYFKLKVNRPHRTKGPPQDFYKCHQSDIWRNPEQDCKLLQVICMNFVPIPSSLESLVLASVSLRLTQSLRNYKLELQFKSEISVMSTPRNVANRRPVEGAIILDPVVSLTVLDWWHPNYPHSNVVYSSDDKIVEEVLKSWDQRPF